MRKFSKFLVVIFILWVNGSAHSTDFQGDESMPSDRRQFFKSLSSLTLEIVDEASMYFNEERSDYPFLARIFHSDLLKYKASGKGGRLPLGCDSKSLERNLLSPEDETLKWWEILKTEFSQCASAWETLWSDPLTNIYGMLGIQLDPIHYPFGKHVVFHLPQGLKVKGLLAMKADHRQRPLVIIRSGIFSNSQEFFPERAYYLQLFEQSPFNVLLLESTSGTEFVKHNRSLRFGGFDEGIQNILIAKILKDPKEPISKYIDSLHLLGVSLGGHGVFSALWLNEFNRDIAGKKLYTSGMNFCPLVQLAETLDFHRAQEYSMSVMNYWASKRLHFLQDRYPEIRTGTFISDFLGILNAQYVAPEFEDSLLSVTWPENVTKILSQPTDRFWGVNNFWSLIPASVQRPIDTPLAIFITEKDPIVPVLLNSQKIIDKKLANEFSNQHVFKFSEGYHCSLQIAYDWNVIASIMQSFFLKFSPDFKMLSKQVKLDIPVDVWTQIQGQQSILDVSFKAKKGEKFVEALVRFDKDFWPSMKEKFLAPQTIFKLPISEIDYPLGNAIYSEAEAQLVSRWAAQNVETFLEGEKIGFRWRVAE